MTATYPPEPWTLVGRMDLSTFLVPTEDLPTATWPDDWRPLVLGGRTPVGAAWVDYAPGGVMSYRELLVAVAGRVGARVRPHIVAIWVDSPASRDGGRALWGIPKGLARFTGVAEGTPDDDARGCGPPGRVARSCATAARLPGTPARRASRWPRTWTGDAARARCPAARASGSCPRDWSFDPDGPLAFLAGRRPVVSATLHDFAMLFGMTPADRARVSQPGGHADVQRQESPHVDPAR